MPGAIVEYKYREVQFKQNIRYLRTEMQQVYPVQKVAYFFKTLTQDYISLDMRLWPFNCNHSPLNAETNGFRSNSVENLPAFQEEPYMLSPPNVRAWILFLYAEQDREAPAKYCEGTGLL